MIFRQPMQKVVYALPMEFLSEDFYGVTWRMVGRAGFEPTTNGLKVSVSIGRVRDPSVLEWLFRKYLFLSMLVSMKSYAWLRY